ncbi:MAG: AAA family ATPase, partial [Snowella sp.]|nr:AAA family ATPase [Snowella sp.]
MRLISAKIKNFKSLEDVELDFRDLTIIVGANATGKSNCLKALEFLKELLNRRAFPKAKIIRNKYLRDNNNDLSVEINLQEKNIPINYRINISTNEKDLCLVKEVLEINNKKIIDIENNRGKVWDEDEDINSEQDYHSSIGSLALEYATVFGNKPITSRLYSFIIHWVFFDFDPKILKRPSNELNKINSFFASLDNDQVFIPEKDYDGLSNEEILCAWSDESQDKFQAINRELTNYLGINLKVINNNDDKIIKVEETDGKKFDFSDLSDGSVRLISYYILLYRDSLPPLICIEEPEQNFHPAMLKIIASILKSLSQRTQVIITTHSSQLLDCFISDEINSDVSVLLL